MDFTNLAAIVLVVFAIILLFSVVKIVPQGRELTVERFGKYTKTLKPGISILTPFVERIGRRMNMMEQVLDVPQQEVITKDNAMVKVDAIVFIQVMEASAAAYRVENLPYAITQLCSTNLRTVVGSMDLDEVLFQRDNINSRLLTVIDAATEPWGVKVNRIEIKDLTPPVDITNAMARQMKAERERRAVITEAEGEKQAAIARAEGAKQSAILQAEGRKEAAFRDAEAREREAQAEAKATEMVSNAIAAGDVNAINYFVAQKYVEAFSELARNPTQKTVIVPAEMGSLVGSIAGIGELVGMARNLQAKGFGLRFMAHRQRRINILWIENRACADHSARHLLHFAYDVERSWRAQGYLQHRQAAGYQRLGNRHRVGRIFDHKHRNHRCKAHQCVNLAHGSSLAKAAAAPNRPGCGWVISLIGIDSMRAR